MPDIPDLGRLDWEDLYPRLILLAERRLRRMVWRGVLRGPIPGGHTCHDFVQIAYWKFADGERTWNPALTAFQNFTQAISSEISNCATAAENTNTIRTDATVTEIADHRQLTPEDKVANNLEVERLLNYLQGKDILAADMARRILIQEITGMRELARAMGFDQNTADATKTRLRRYVVKYKEENPFSVFAQTPKKS
jgi:hypothetical protein